ATIGGNKTTVKLLLNTRAYNINTEDRYSQTAFSWATGKGYSKITQLLIARGVTNVDLADYSGRTLLS
ncbi:hypothetical protein LY78DRAFT_591649, partial [Colletotrichum sublineola]